MLLHRQDFNDVHDAACERHFHMLRDSPFFTDPIVEAVMRGFLTVDVNAKFFSEDRTCHLNAMQDHNTTSSVGLRKKSSFAHLNLHEIHAILSNPSFAPRTGALWLPPSHPITTITCH